MNRSEHRTLNCISRCIKHENAKSFNNGLSAGISALERARVWLACNHKLEEPYTIEQIVEWIEEDIKELKSMEKDPGRFPTV